MTHDPVRAPGAPDPGVGFREFVALIAALMAINALGIDIMLPALPAIGQALHFPTENDQQFIIAGYVFGFGAGQLLYGPLADRFGRKPVLLVGLVVFTLLSLGVSFAGTFHTMVAARMLQGVGAAAARVVATSIVRDCYQGRQMARINSLTTLVFLAVPIVAPTIGQAILTVAPWRAVFLFLAAFGAFDLLWAGLRLRETLHPEHRRPLAPREVMAAAWLIVGNRTSLGYTAAGTFIFGSLMGYIDSVQQIFADSFRAPTLMAPVFAVSAAGMAAASLLNARIVERVGMRRVSHAAILGFILVGLAHTLVAINGRETLVHFALFMIAQLFCFGMFSPNAGAMAMEPVGRVAGTAASIQGFAQTVGGALLGIIIGQMFDGSVLPLAAGFVVLGVAALLLVLITERGRLFRPHQIAPA